MAEAKNITVDPQELARAQELWLRFTKFMTWGVIGSAATLIVMAITLL